MNTISEKTKKINENYPSWVSQIRNSDSKAENELFEHFYPLVRRHVIGKLGKNNQDWQDLAIDSVMAVIENLRNGKYDSEFGKLPSYIFIITRNKINKYLETRSRGQYQKTVDPHSPEYVNYIAETNSSEEQEREQQLMKLIDALESKYKEPIKLKFYEKMRLVKIKNELGLESEQQVSNRISYGLALLRNSLDKRKLF